MSCRIRTDVRVEILHSHVGYPPKLFQEIPGDEGNNCVLGSDNLVGSIVHLLLYSALVIIALLRKVLMHKDGAGGTRLPLPTKDILDVER